MTYYRRRFETFAAVWWRLTGTSDAIPALSLNSWQPLATVLYFPEHFTLLSSSRCGPPTSSFFSFCSLSSPRRSKHRRLLFLPVSFWTHFQLLLLPFFLVTWQQSNVFCLLAWIAKNRGREKKGFCFHSSDDIYQYIYLYIQYI